MAAKKKSKKPAESWLVTDFGEFRILSADGKFYNCEDRRFLRRNPHIRRIEERPCGEAPASETT